LLSAARAWENGTAPPKLGVAPFPGPGAVVPYPKKRRMRLLLLPERTLLPLMMTTVRLPRRRRKRLLKCPNSILFHLFSFLADAAAS
jgi:hypothetical protein